MAVVRLCVDCKHFDNYRCTVPGKVWKVNPVDGTSIEGGTADPYYMRAGQCGWDFPRFWEPKDEPKQR